MIIMRYLYVIHHKRFILGIPEDYETQLSTSRIIEKSPIAKTMIKMAVDGQESPDLQGTESQASIKCASAPQNSVDFNAFDLL